MAPLKKLLKEAREKKNLTVQQVAALTNIKTEHIRALEEGNYGFFSAPIYIRGFVRSIAIALKLDVTEVMSQLDVELSDQRDSLKNADLQRSAQPLEASAATSTLKVLPWKWIGMMMLLLILCVIGFFVLRHFDVVQGEKSGMPGQPGVQTPGIIEKNHGSSLDPFSTNRTSISQGGSTLLD